MGALFLLRNGLLPPRILLLDWTRALLVRRGLRRCGVLVGVRVGLFIVTLFFLELLVGVMGAVLP